jgi:hypothetical protein
MKLFQVFAIALLALFVVPTTANAAKFFVDNKLGEVKPEERVTVSNPQPVQLIFEFQRDGKLVPAAVKQVKPMIIDALKERVIFSDVTEKPVASGALLNIVINNVVNKEELSKLKGKAFGAGLSFGLASGFVATDRYLISFELIPATGKAPIISKLEHALHMKYGNTAVEVDGTQVKNAMEAVRGVVRQAIAKGMNTVASNPGFSSMSVVQIPSSAPGSEGAPPAK